MPEWQGDEQKKQETSSTLSTLLADLSDMAATLNRESDSINELIQRFEETLRQLNIGLEVWCPDPIVSLPLEERGSDGKKSPDPMYLAFLGFARRAGGWHLCLRGTLSRYGKQDQTQLPPPHDSLLLDSSRALRIAALQQFPALLCAMKAKTQAAVQDIKGAKKFVGLA